jgi:hypothetical protein
MAILLFSKFRGGEERSLVIDVAIDELEKDVSNVPPPNN